MLVDQPARVNTCGKVIMNCIEDMIIESGLYAPLWDMDVMNISKWISHHPLIFATCQYNYNNQIRIKTFLDLNAKGINQ